MDTFKALKSALKLLMLLVLTGWTVLWFIRPTTRFAVYWKSLSSSAAYGASGWFILFYSAPVILLVFLGAIYLQLNKNPSNRALKVNPWTFPVIVRGPLAVVSAGELIFLVLLIGLLAWTLAEYLHVKFSKITPEDLEEERLKLWQKKLEISGSNLGLTGVICLAILFFPITRGSVFHRLVNVPFEHAVKYHIWIGHLMMIVWTAHGLCYLVLWPSTGQTMELLLWHRTYISGLSGVLVYLVGVVMWIASLRPVRKRKFELFYYTHQLYVLFILGFALHVGDKLYYCIAAGVVLFLLNRLLRYLQSRNRVDVLLARMVTSETMELWIAKQPGLEYHPAGFIMVNFPVVAPLQWHPFTIVSSPSVEKEHLSLLIKCNGGWTMKLKEFLLRSHQSPEAQVEAAAEGPYGQNMDYILRYDVLVFVAGGSGISPFISILKDLLYNVQNERVPASKQIILVWAMKKAEDLSILQLVSPSSLCPDYTNQLNVEVLVYVTRQEVDLEETTEPCKTMSEPIYTCSTSKTARPLIEAEGIHNEGLHAVLVTASFLGFVAVAGVLGRCFVFPMDGNSGDVFPRSLDGFFAFISTMVGVVVFGGGALAIWIRLSRRSSSRELSSEKMLPALCKTGALRPSKVHYGNRPDLHDIFSGFAKRFPQSEVGVFACGPAKMQRSSAVECQLYRFHYHPLNYDL